MKAQRVVGVVAALLSAGLGFALWLFLAPLPLGGSTSYAVIVGQSMEPQLERGDLALVRAAGSYDVGDVVLYDNTRLGADVLHRIVAVKGDRFVLKGDNNNFMDGDEPTADRIRGKLWADVPFAGTAFEWTRTPLNAAILVGAAVLLALGGSATATTRRSRRRRAEAPAPSARRVRAGATRRPLALEPVALGLAVALAVFTALGLLAFGRPTTQNVKVDGAWVERGAFSYAAAATPGAVYPSGRATTGEPVFLKLADRVEFAFAYRIETDEPVAVSGTGSLKAVLGDGLGWTRTVTLQEPARFSDGKTTLRGTLDLKSLQAIAARVKQATGATMDSFTVSVEPRVTLEGTIGGRPVEEQAFAPTPLGFRLDDIRLVLDSAGAEDTSFTRSRPGTGARVEPGSLSLAGFSLRVELARTLALGGGGVVLAALLAVGLVALRRRGDDEPARIETRFGDLLVPVARSHGQHTGRLAELRDMESLVAIAQRYDRLILHQRHEGVHYYVVEDDGVVYRYQAREEGAEQDLRLAPYTEAATAGGAVVVSPAPAVEGALIPGGGGRRYGVRRFIRSRVEA